MIPTDKLKRLQRLREIFLGEAGKSQAYWQDLEDLDVYDSVFGVRLGEKWRAVWQEILENKKFPEITQIVDFGCGSARATRETLKKFPNVKKIHLVDHSEIALDWSENFIKKNYPKIEVLKSKTLEGTDKNSWLLLSHVVNELAPAEIEKIKLQTEDFFGFVWVEAGTPVHSRFLVELREILFKKGKKRNILGPCPDGARECPLAGKSNSADWCHTFTRGHSDLHQDGEFNRALKSLGIDNRSLPYSYLAYTQKMDFSAVNLLGLQSRVIGRPRVYKGFVRFLCCDSRLGLADMRFQKRESNNLFKAFKEDSVRYLNNFRFDGIDCKKPSND